MQQRQAKAKRVTERRKRMLETDTAEMVTEKLKRVNEPGETVKCLPFDFCDAEMDDIEDIPESLPEHRQGVQQQQLVPRFARVITLCFNLNLSF